MPKDGEMAFNCTYLGGPSYPPLKVFFILWEAYSPNYTSFKALVSYLTF